MAMFAPSHPGEIVRELIEGLREETGARLTIEEVALSLGTTRKTLSAILNQHQSITPDMALRLAAAFRNTTAELWLTLQERYDLALARQRVSLVNVRVLWEPVAS